VIFTYIMLRPVIFGAFCALLGCTADANDSGADDLKSRPASQVELKITLAPGQIDAARAALKLSSGAAEKRAVYFYDTQQLDLFNRGVILRARKMIGDDDDSTVKIRPLGAAQVAKSWFSMDGFKCEIDRVGAKSVESCSLTARQDKDEIDDVAAAERSIDKLYSDAQERLLGDYGMVPSWKSLRALGPVKAQVWHVSRPGVASELTAELWTLPNQARILEISTRVGAAKASATLADLTHALEKLGLDARGVQETKTKAALAFFAAQAK
jgi:hypothetical protein